MINELRITKESPTKTDSMGISSLQTMKREKKEVEREVGERKDNTEVGKENDRDDGKTRHKHNEKKKTKKEE